MYKINNSICISCGACAAECAHDAVSQGEKSFVIDDAICTKCGMCVPVCPMDCIDFLE